MPALSTEMLRISIPIDVPPQGRPRFTRTGVAYDPPQSRKFKAAFALALKTHLRDTEPTAKPVSVKLRISRAGFRKGVTSRRFGDIDNLTKIVLDAITQTGAVWKDDSQVVELEVRKAAANESRVELSIEEVN